MRLLVSVRSVDEVGAALAGGADVIDVKEPSRGALGAADPDVVRAITDSVPPTIPVSVALGDPDTADVPAIISRLEPRPASGEIILKLGFAGVASEIDIETRLRIAIDTGNSSMAPTVVAVAYADWQRVGAPSPSDVVRGAWRVGARGVLLDTFFKDGRDLFASITLEGLNRWTREARLAGLLVAVAGSIDVGSVHRLRAAAPDVIGVRGAACDGGRLGRVSAERVRGLRLAMDAINRRPWVDGPAANRQTIAPRSAP